MHTKHLAHTVILAGLTLPRPCTAQVTAPVSTSLATTQISHPVVATSQPAERNCDYTSLLADIFNDVVAHPDFTTLCRDIDTLAGGWDPNRNIKLQFRLAVIGQNQKLTESVAEKVKKLVNIEGWNGSVEVRGGEIMEALRVGKLVREQFIEVPTYDLHCLTGDEHKLVTKNGVTARVSLSAIVAPRILWELRDELLAAADEARPPLIENYHKQLEAWKNATGQFEGAKKYELAIVRIYATEDVQIRDVTGTTVAP